MKRLFPVLLFAVTILLASCDSDIIEQEGAPSQNSVSISKAEFHPVGGTVSFSISSDENWSIKPADGTQPSWITISPMSGNAGTKTVEITAGVAKENIDENLVIMTGSRELAEINIKQEKPYLRVVLDVYGQNVDPDSVNFAWNNNTSSRIIVHSNTDWTIKDAKTIDEIDGGCILNNWIWFSDYNGKASESRNGQEITINPMSYNLEESDHTLSFNLVGATDSIVFNMQQGHMKLTANPQDQDNLVFAPCNSVPIELKLNSEFDSWTFYQMPEWLSADVKSGSEKEKSVVLTASINRQKSQLADTIVIRGYIKEDGITKTADRKLVATLDPYKFQISKNSIELDAGFNGYIQNIEAISSGKWSLSDIPEWVNVSPQNGKGIEYGDDTPTNLVFRPNEMNYDMENSRTHEIKFNSNEGNGLVETITVIQNKYAFEATPETVSIGTVDTDKKDLEIKCSGDWKLVSNASWLELSPTSGSGSETVKYNARTANNTSSDKKAVITLKSISHEDKGLSYTPLKFDIKQEKFVFDISPSTTSKQFASISTASTTGNKHNLTITSSVKWEASNSNTTWLHTTPKSGNNGTTNVEIKVDDNYSFSTRRGSVKFTNEYNNTSHTISISQGPFEFDTKSASVDFSAVKPTEESVNLGACIGKWNVRNTASSWLKVTPTSGEGGQTITIKPNTDHHSKTRSSGKARTAQVRIESEFIGENPELVKEITVTQAAHIFGVASNTATVTATTPASIKVECSSSWDASCSADWIELSPTSKNGDGTLQIKAKNKNGSKSARTATVVVKNTVGETTFEENITVTQAAGV